MLAVKKFIRLSNSEKKYFFKAAFFCVVFKVMIFLVPLKVYVRLLGKQNIYVYKEPSETERHYIYIISKSIVRARKVIPWRSQCLTEAITAKIMLRKYKVESTLYLGINKNEHTMKAHAWLKCGSNWVIGKKGSEKFTVISTFT